MQILEHPCFEEHPTGRYARIHLPVAPKCNIQCRYCNRKYDCANESRPGVTSKVIRREEALLEVENARQKFSGLRVAGVAGPGEPLANEETFETLKLVKKQFPDLILCVSTNGLLLLEKLERLLDCGVETLTVTVNSLDEAKIPLLYSGTGEVDAHEFVRRQREGVRQAVLRGLAVKINTVLVPGINEEEVEKIAAFGKETGAVRMNLMPLIPQGEFEKRQPPDGEMLNLYRKKAAVFLTQMYHCRQCRADACGYLGK